MNRRIILPVALLAAALAAGPAAAQMSYGKAPRVPQEPELPPGVGLDQKLGAKVPLDLVFYDHDGKPVRLGDCVNGKPTIEKGFAYKKLHWVDLPVRSEEPAADAPLVPVLAPGASSATRRRRRALAG